MSATRSTGSASSPTPCCSRATCSTRTGPTIPKNRVRWQFGVLAPPASSSTTVRARRTCRPSACSRARDVDAHRAGAVPARAAAHRATRATATASSTPTRWTSATRPTCRGTRRSCTNRGAFTLPARRGHRRRRTSRARAAAETEAASTTATIVVGRLACASGSRSPVGCRWTVEAAARPVRHAAAAAAAGEHDAVDSAASGCAGPSRRVAARARRRAPACCHVARRRVRLDDRHAGVGVGLRRRRASRSALPGARRAGRRPQPRARLADHPVRPPAGRAGERRRSSATPPRWTRCSRCAR